MTVGDGSEPTSPADPAVAADGPRAGRWFVIGLVAIVAIGWAIRLIYVWHWRQHTVFGGDPLYYHLGADLLADGKGFINPYAHARDLTVQAADHPPLYLM